MNILAVCLSTTIERTVVFRDLNLSAVNRSEYYRMDASGKAVNAARVLCQLEEGCATVVCPVGKENAKEFMTLAMQDGLIVDAVETPGRTRECWTLLDRLHETTTELVADERYEHDTEFPEEEGALLGVLEKDLKNADALLLAGSRPTMWSEGLMAYIARMASDANKFFLADYHGDDLERTLAVCTPDAIKINKEEFCTTFSLNPFITDDILIANVADKSCTLNNIIIVTQGTRPTIAAMKGEAVVFPVEKVKAVNTMGCGDAFSAGFLHEYLETGDFSGALAKGTWCAARNAEREGPGTIER